MTARGIGFAAIGAALTGLLAAVYIGISLFARGVQIDIEGGDGFSTGPELGVLFGGLAVAVVAGAVGLVLLARGHPANGVYTNSR
jgi:hypothetical protein